MPAGAASTVQTGLGALTSTASPHSVPLGYLRTHRDGRERAGRGDGRGSADRSERETDGEKGRRAARGPGSQTIKANARRSTWLNFGATIPANTMAYAFVDIVAVWGTPVMRRMASPIGTNVGYCGCRIATPNVARNLCRECAGECRGPGHGHLAHGRVSTIDAMAKKGNSMQVRGMLCVLVLLSSLLPALAQRRDVTIRGKDATTLETLATARGKTVDETLQEELDRTLDRLALETLDNQLEAVRLHLLSLTAGRSACGDLPGGAAFRAQEGVPAEAPLGTSPPRVGPGAMPRLGLAGHGEHARDMGIVSDAEVWYRKGRCMRISVSRCSYAQAAPLLCLVWALLGLPSLAGARPCSPRRAALRMSRRPSPLPP